jgi:hypothetical protein
LPALQGHFPKHRRTETFSAEIDTRTRCQIVKPGGLLLSTNLNQINRPNASAMDKIVHAAAGIPSSIKRKQGSAARSGSRSNLSRD